MEPEDRDVHSCSGDGPARIRLQCWPGAVVMMFIATMTAALVTNSGRPAWLVGVPVLTVYVVFAITLYLLPHT